MIKFHPVISGLDACKYYNFTDIVPLYFINYSMDTQLKILKYSIENYDDEEL